MVAIFTQRSLISMVMLLLASAQVQRPRYVVRLFIQFLLVRQLLMHILADPFMVLLLGILTALL